MDIHDGVWVAIFAAGCALLLFKRRRVKEFATLMAERLQEEIDNFPRGGPPTPMHPSPAGDDALLRRPSKKVAS